MPASSAQAWRQRRPWLLLLVALAGFSPWSACSSAPSPAEPDAEQPKNKKKRRRGRKRDRPKKPAPGEPLTPLFASDRPEPSEIETLAPTRANAPCDSSPAESLWRAPVADWPIHSRSEAWLGAIGRERTLNLDANHTVIDLRSAVAPTSIHARSPANSDSVPWFIPSDAAPFRPLNTQRTPRMVVLDHVHCRSYEFFGPVKTDQGWSVDTANAFDLQTVRRRRVGWHRETEGTRAQESAHDASGASVLAGLLRVASLKSGRPIEHALGVSVPALDRAYMPPATHGASDMSNPDFPPSGARLRLRDTVDCMEMSGPARQVCITMQQYGLVITSQGPTMALTGEAMDWDLYRAMAPLATLTAGDFDVVGIEDPIRYGTTGTRFRGGAGVEDPDASRAPDEKVHRR